MYIDNFVEQIYDESIGEILVKRDEEMRNAKEREEIMRIHTELLGNIIKVYIYMYCTDRKLLVD